MWTIPSPSPEAKNSPSGENANSLTFHLCSANAIAHEASPTLHSRTANVLVSELFDIAAIYSPSVEKHAPEHSPPPPLSDAVSCHDSASQIFTEPSSDTDIRERPSGENETSTTALSCPRTTSVVPLTMSQTATHPECSSEIPPHTDTSAEGPLFTAIPCLRSATATCLLRGWNESVRILKSRG